MSVGHLYVLFGEMSIQVLCPFLVGLFVFSALAFVYSLLTLDINPLSDESVNMFPYSIACIFIMFMVSFAVQKFFSLM